ncbi:hypothetical protein C8R43DRAFT_961206 [Mycena crocata]|nr:hypothetical protein C8R43DRAFT_961206 [Mycena crocata]
MEECSSRCTNGERNERWQDSRFNPIAAIDEVTACGKVGAFDSSMYSDWDPRGAGRFKKAIPGRHEENSVEDGLDPVEMERKRARTKRVRPPAFSFAEESYRISILIAIISYFPSMDPVDYTELSDDVELGLTEVLVDGNTRRRCVKPGTQTAVLTVVFGRVEQITQLPDNTEIILLKLESESSPWQQQWLSRLSDTVGLGIGSWMQMDDDGCTLFIRTDSSTIVQGSIHHARVRCLINPIIVDGAKWPPHNEDAATQEKQLHLDGFIIGTIPPGPAYSLTRIRQLDILLLSHLFEITISKCIPNRVALHMYMRDGFVAQLILPIRSHYTESKNGGIRTSVPPGPFYESIRQPGYNPVRGTRKQEDTQLATRTTPSSVAVVNSALFYVTIYTYKGAVGHHAVDSDSSGGFLDPAVEMLPVRIGKVFDALQWLEKNNLAYKTANRREVDEDEDSEIQQEFVDTSTGAPLTANVVGRVSEIISVDTLNHNALESMARLDDEEARIVFGVEQWSQEPNRRVIVRFNRETIIGPNLVSDMDIVRFSQTFPLAPSGRRALDIDAMVICRVTFCRKDTPLAWARTQSGRIPYSRPIVVRYNPGVAQSGTMSNFYFLSNNVEV